MLIRTSESPPPLPNPRQLRPWDAAEKRWTDGRNVASYGRTAHRLYSMHACNAAIIKPKLAFGRITKYIDKVILLILRNKPHHGHLITNINSNNIT